MSEPPPDPTTSAAAGIGAKRQRAPGAGRPRKSAAIHYLEGTRSRAPARGRNKQSAGSAGATRAIDPALVTPPKGIPARARAFWLLNAPPLAKAGRLELHHLSYWKMLCIRYADWELAEHRLARLQPHAESYAVVAAMASKACDQVCKMAARFGLEYLSDIRLNAIDGSSVSDAAPAPQLPAEATNEDPGARWEREFGARSG